LDTLTVFSTRFLGIFIEAAPFLLLGTLTSGLIEAFLRHEDLVRLVPRHPLLAPLAGGLLGLAFPVCECGVVPVTRRLYRKGLPVSVGVSFLLASPVINPIVIASTYAAFHVRAIEIVYLRVGVSLTVAVAVGAIFSVQRQADRLLRTSAPGDALPVHDEQDGGRVALLPGLQQALTVAADEFFEMGRYLILGALLATATRFVVSQDQLEDLATNPVNSVLIMQALAFILSICSTADAFVALDFANTFTLGSVLGFLTFGPMVDIKSTIMFLGVFRRRTVVYLILLPFLMTTLVAITVNLNVRF
jgi:uncharacterized membrane protein YraQ (UPF0718 family)